MLRALDELRMGLILPKAFMSEVKLKNSMDLAISRQTLLPSLPSAGVTALDLEKIEERYLLYGGKNGTIAVFDLEPLPNKSHVVGHLRPSDDTHSFCVVRVQWYPFDTGIFTTSARCRYLRIWDANSLRPVDSYKFDFHINTHDMSRLATRHNLIAVATSNPAVLLYDVKNGLSTHTLKGHELGCETVTWSPMEENLLASGGLDGRILLWDIRSSKGFLKCLDQHNSQGDTEFGPKPPGPKPSPFRPHSINRNLCVAHDAYVTNLKFTDNGLYLVSRSVNQEILLWDVALAKNMLVNYGVPLKLKPAFELPFAFEIFSDTKLPLLYNPFHCNIDVHDLYTGIKHTTLVGHFRFANCCVYRSSTQELYSGGNDMNVITWSPNRGNKFEDSEIQEIDLVDDDDAWSVDSD